MAVVNRWYRILELLVTQQRLTLEELRSDLNISLSTLQKSIEQLNELLDSDLQIKQEGQLVSLEVYDYRRLEDILAGSLRKGSDFNSSSKRTSYLIRRLVRSSQPLLIDDLAEEIGVSRTTINKDLRQVKDLAAAYQVNILGRPNRGLEVSGSELNLRLFYIHHVYAYFDSDSLTEESQCFLEDLYQTFKLPKKTQDLLTQGSNLWAAKVNQQKAGYFTYWRLKNTALSDDIAADYVVMLPVHAEGYEASLARTEDEIEFGAALTIQNHDIPSSLRWLDAQFETENMLVAQNGKIGDTLILRGDGRYEVTYVPAGNELYKTVPIICGQFFAPASYYASVYVPAAHRQEKSAYCALYDESGVLEEVPYTLLINTVPITSEESARIQQLYTSLKSAVNAYLVEFVTRGVTDERFADFLTELNSIGAQEYVSLYQTAYDRYMKGLSEQ